jgi:hypothetical protein
VSGIHASNAKHHHRTKQHHTTLNHINALFLEDSSSSASLRCFPSGPEYSPHDAAISFRPQKASQPHFILFTSPAFQESMFVSW